MAAVVLRIRKIDERTGRLGDEYVARSLGTTHHFGDRTVFVLQAKPLTDPHPGRASISRRKPCINNGDGLESALSAAGAPGHAGSAFSWCRSLESALSAAVKSPATVQDRHFHGAEVSVRPRWSLMPSRFHNGLSGIGIPRRYHNLIGLVGRHRYSLPQPLPSGRRKECSRGRRRCE